VVKKIIILPETSAYMAKRLRRLQQRRVRMMMLCIWYLDQFSRDKNEYTKLIIIAHCNLLHDLSHKN